MHLLFCWINAGQSVTVRKHPKNSTFTAHIFGFIEQYTCKYDCPAGRQKTLDPVAHYQLYNRQHEYQQHVSAHRRTMPASGN